VPRLILLGVGTAKSSRFAPAGLLVEYGHARVGLDGGPGSEPPENVQAWLVSDPHHALQPARRQLATEEGMPLPEVGAFSHGALRIEAVPVSPSLHGYRILSGRYMAVWAPEYAVFPDWAEDADLMFADGTALDGTGAHLGVLASALAAQRRRVKRLIFVRLDEPVFAALDRGEPPPFGEWGEEGRTYRM
jgi:hypothetical protein